MSTRKKAIIAVVAGLIVLVGVIGSIVYMQTTKSQQGSTVDTSAAVATDVVTIKDFAFSPALIKVKAGTTVTWTNQDAIRHSVTADTGVNEAFDSGLITSKTTYTHTFDKAGTFHYHCTPHPYMKGAIIVT